ncbi:hypothetical protein [Ruegeria sp. Alg231-54]|uniref:hypothetical protein n=1 Tax=Ruegeria sp. Alg231-54 TaxID=1922221 RepID=UPI001F1CE321|nr:hypothetical protein [Ruegeria sp. Alg231-54]
MKAHLGTGIAGFPNFIILLGPHICIGRKSVVLMIEAQVRHIGRALDQMGRDGLQAVTPCPKNRLHSNRKYKRPEHDALAQDRFRV